jgi:hypothetical protein
VALILKVMRNFTQQATLGTRGYNFNLEPGNEFKYDWKIEQ